MTKVVIVLEHEVAADVLALVKGFDGNYDHPFTKSCGKAVSAFQNVLEREECAQGDQRYVEFAAEVNDDGGPFE